MLLESIELENYRPYQGPEIIRFADNTDKNITIINGRNDAGKTSLLNAFTWCLYGKEFYRNKANKSKEEHICNKRSLNNIDINQSIKVKVTINMEDENGKKVKFIRCQEAKKTGKNNCFLGKSEFKIIVQDNDEEQILSAPENYMHKHLPEDLREYYLFEGEKLINFFKNDNNSSLRKAVKNLTQLNLLDNIIHHVQNYEKKLTNEYNKIDPNLGKLNNQRLNLKDSLERDRSKFEENNNQIEIHENKIDELRKDIQQYGDNPKGIIDDQKKLDDEIKNLESRLNQLEKNRLSYLIQNFSIIMGYNDVKNFLNISEELKENKFIPSPYKKDFLEELLKSDICICGTKLSDNEDCYNTIQKLYEETDESSNHEDYINQLIGKCEDFIEDYPKDFQRNVKINNQDIRTLKNKSLIPKKEDRRILDLKLEDMDIEDINKKSKKIKELKKSIIDLNKTNAILEQNIKDIPYKINKKNDEINKANHDNEYKKQIDLKIKFCEDILKRVNNIADELNENIYFKLKQITTEEFTKIHWKNSYKEIHVSDNYEVTIEKKDGSIIMATDPSDGSELILALSFMIALNSLAGIQLPMIIDTPMGKLDNEMKNSLAETLPQYIKNKQLTLLVTNSEYSPEFKERLEPYVGQEYTLEYHEDENGEFTRVI